MERNIPEFEAYLSAMNGYLDSGNSRKEEICNEIRCNLYEKYNDCLIKGFGMDAGINETLDSFESPESLARRFNSIYAEPPFRMMHVRALRRIGLFAAVVAVLLLVTIF